MIDRKKKVQLLIYLCVSFSIAFVLIFLMGCLLGVLIVYFQSGVFKINVSDFLVSLKMIFIGIPLGVVVWLGIVLKKKISNE